MLFAALTFNVKNVFATDTNIDNNNGTNNNNTDINNNDGLDTNLDNNLDTNTDNDTDIDTDNGTDTGNDNLDDDEDGSMLSNLLYGAGGVVLGSALTYFLTRNRDAV